MEAFELTLRILLAVHSVLGELAAHRYRRTKKGKSQKFGKYVEIIFPVPHNYSRAGRISQALEKYASHSRDIGGTNATTYKCLFVWEAGSSAPSRLLQLIPLFSSLLLQQSVHFLLMVLKILPQKPE